MALQTDKLDSAFKLIDDYRSRGLRLAESAAHAAVDTGVGNHEALAFAYCRRDEPDRERVIASADRLFSQRGNL